MNDCKRFGVVGLVAFAFLMILADLAGAEQVMILRYDDGTSQMVRLERPSEAIIQIEFSGGKRTPGPDRAWYPNQGDLRKLRIELWGPLRERNRSSGCRL